MEQRVLLTIDFSLPFFSSYVLLMVENHSYFFDRQQNNEKEVYAHTSLVCGSSTNLNRIAVFRTKAIQENLDE